MLLLPKTLGPLTLTQKVGVGAIAETFEGSLTGPAPKPVRVRRILPAVLQDRARLTSVEARVGDLKGLKHPFLLSVLDWVEAGNERLVVEESTERISLDQVLQHARKHNRPLPENVFLNIAAQICNGLEALHGRPGRGTGAENVLHLGLRPAACWVDSEGKVLLGDCSLVRSPLSLPGAASGSLGIQLEYLSPEQTHTAQKLTPASDVFSLGTLLFELFTLTPLFAGETGEITIQQVRRADVTSQLLKVKERLPGLDKILFRALAVNPRHRYQRAFVLREDLRGLMAGFSFSNISRDSALYLSPLFEAKNSTTPHSLADGPPASAASGFQDSATRIDPDPAGTAADTSKALQERAQRDSKHAEEEWFETKGTEVKDDPFDSESDPSSGEISLYPEESLSLDPAEESLETDLGLQGTFPPKGAESTLGFISTPQAPAGAGLTDPPPAAATTLPPLPAPTDPPAQAKVPTPTAGRTEFEPLPTPDSSAKGSQGESSDMGNSSPPPSSPHFAPLPDVPEDWNAEPLDGGRKKKKKKPGASTATMAVAGFLVAAVLLVGLKLILREDPSPNPALPALGPEPVAQIQAITPEEQAELEAEERAEAEAEAALEAEREAAEALAQEQAAAAAERSSRTRRSTAAVYTPPAQNYDDVAYFPEPEPQPALDSEESAEGQAVERLRTDVSGFLALAESGQLSRNDVYDLEAVGTDDDSYTQSRALLLMNAEQARSARDVKKYLDQLFLLDENRYSPVFLSKRARWFANNGKYDRALADAQKAEQHWARIPSELVFPTKTEIFEVQASSLQGMFYSSEDDIELLDKAVRGWKKYQRHVEPRRTDLFEHAEAQIRKLDYARTRLR